MVLPLRRRANFAELALLVFSSALLSLQSPRDGPSWPKMAPSWPQDSPKMAPRWHHNGPKMALRYPEMVHCGFEIAPGWPTSSTTAPTMAPRGLQHSFPEPRKWCSRLGAVQILLNWRCLSFPLPSCHFKAFKMPQDCPKWPQDGHKMAPR